MMRMTSRPAIRPASFVAWRWPSLKYAGTVMTAFCTVFAEVLLGDQLHLLQDVRADLGDAEHLVAQHDAHVVVRTLDDAVRHDLERAAHRGRAPLAADQALRGVDRVLGVRDRLALRDVTDEPLAVLGDRDHRRRRLVAAAVRDDGRRAVLDDRHARVRRAEVDADHLVASHGSLIFPPIFEQIASTSASENMGPPSPGPSVVCTAPRCGILLVAVVLGSAASCADDGVRHTPDATPQTTGRPTRCPTRRSRRRCCPVRPARPISATSCSVRRRRRSPTRSPTTASNLGHDQRDRRSRRRPGFALSDNTCSGVTLAHARHLHVRGRVPAAGRGPRDGDRARRRASPGGEITRDLTGNGLQPGALDITEASHDYTKLAVDATPTTHTFTVKNTGQVATGIPMPSITGTASTYSIQSTTCTAALAAERDVQRRRDVRSARPSAASRPRSSSPARPAARTPRRSSGIGVAHVAITKTGNGPAW